MSELKTHVDSYELSAKQLNFYKDNGYLHLKKVWSDEEVNVLRGDSDEYADGLFTNKLNAHKYKSLQQAHTCKKMCDIGDTILNGRAVPIGSILFYCKPNNPYEHGSTWHQDNYAGKAPNGDNYLNLAVALDDAEESNGALKIVPGSHKLGDLPCNPKPNFSYDEQGRRYNSAPIGNNCELPDLPVLQLEYEAGDVLVVHSQLVHKADRNEHPNRWRRTMYFVYVNDGTSFWPGWTAKRELLDRYDWSE